MEIVSRAPNLQEFQNRLCLDWVEYFPVEKTHIIKDIMLPMHLKPCIDGTKISLLWDKFLQSEPKLHALTLRYFVAFGNFTREKYLNGLISIIRCCSDSLRMMELDYGGTLDLKTISERLIPLSNVLRLSLNIFMAADVQTAQEFQRWSLALIFPNVTTVVFSFLESVQSLKAEGSELFPWTTVTKVELKYPKSRNVNVNVAELGLLFPNAHTLEISRDSSYFDPMEFQQILSSWGF